MMTRLAHVSPIVIKFKTLMLKSSLCDYSDAYILLSGTITITGAGVDAAARQAVEINKGVLFKNCALFTDCIREIKNTQIDNAKGLDILMLMYNSIKYSNNNKKISRSLQQYYRDEPNANLADSETFKSKMKITGSAPTDGNTNYVKIAVSLKYLNNFWRTPEMSLNTATNLRHYQFNWCKGICNN